ncbi:MAG: tol-pal system protein YbgF [Aquificaceae bacterium]|nr:MAG: tol-pal system protein YbgF [Aquificaceae bacterium]
MMTLKQYFLLPIILSYLFITPLQARDNSDALLELFQRIDVLNRDLRTLRGENEQLQHQIDTLKKAQKDGFLNVDDRIDELSKQIRKAPKPTNNTIATKPPIKKPVPPPVAKKPPVKKPVVAATTPKKPVIKVPVVPKPPAKPKAKLIGKAEVVNVPKTKIRSATNIEKSAYNQAYTQLKNNPSAATQAFKHYLQKYPSSPLAANAQYWIGEIMYSRKNYQGAIDEFVKVLQNYKKSEKAPDAAIKLGFSFYELKNWVYARRALENVIRYYPKTRAAALAKQRIAKMKTEKKY